jgi:hypothetical protein
MAGNTSNPWQNTDLFRSVYLSLTIRSHFYAHKSLRTHMGNYHTNLRRERN